MSAFTATLDTREQRRFLDCYRADAIDRELRKASDTGAKAAAVVLRSQTPVGTAARLSQYYRARGLRHGALRRSVRAAPIRGRGSALKGLQGRTIGNVIGPLGRNAFTRRWVEEGFDHVGGTHVLGKHFVAQAAIEALGVARVASESVLEAYGRG